MNNFKRNKMKKYIVIFFILFLIIFSFYKVDRDLKPLIMAYCDSEARIIAARTINETVRTEFANKITYDDVMNVKIDKDGNIVMIQANTVELNRIGSEIALSVQQKIEEIESAEAKIPLGALLKNDLLAYYGPKITFKMQPMGSVTTTYRSEFQEAGINQTRHIVYLDITSNIIVIVPLSRNYVSMTSSIPIAESIIVGKVPDAYANFKEEKK